MGRFSVSRPRSPGYGLQSSIRRGAQERTRLHHALDHRVDRQPHGSRWGLRSVAEQKAAAAHTARQRPGSTRLPPPAIFRFDRVERRSPRRATVATTGRSSSICKSSGCALSARKSSVAFVQRATTAKWSRCAIHTPRRARRATDARARRCDAERRRRVPGHAEPCGRKSPQLVGICAPKKQERSHARQPGATTTDGVWQ